ncbi:hypothetical protein RIF29_39159 [Crotalaria pallida]|uniref:Uncharacterized protein n=1 Tax=Crotalaria pallida TaxID=3830 RepID=A0AAN9E0L2_CROPI
MKANKNCLPPWEFQGYKEWYYDDPIEPTTEHTTTDTVGVESALVVPVDNVELEVPTVSLSKANIEPTETEGSVFGSSQATNKKVASASIQSAERKRTYDQILDLLNEPKNAKIEPTKMKIDQGRKNLYHCSKFCTSTCSTKDGGYGQSMV